MNKSKNKYYNTACLMDEALLLLLEKKDFEYITVKEICEKAGVNRSTFYLHYDTMYDLLEESLTFMFSRFTAKYEYVEIDRSKVMSCMQSELFLVTPQYIIPYLEFLRENKKIFMVAITKPTIFQLSSYFNSIYQKVFEPILERFHIELQERKYILAFYISGMHAIIIEWIKSGCEEELDYIADLLIKYTIPCGNGGKNDSCSKYQE